MAAKGNNRRNKHRVIKWALLYVIVSITYYFLPWSVRQPVHNFSAKLDRILMINGFRLVNAWDELAWVGTERSTAIDASDVGKHAVGGFPSQGLKLVGRVQVLENEGYVSGYSESLKNPLWVCYRIFDVPTLEHGKRPSRFKVDKRTRSKVSHDDYTHSGFDRGHLAPNYGIATRYGMDAQRETFLMSNIIPQAPAVNQRSWKDLELKVAKRYGRYFSDVWVITGPIFDDPVKRLKSGVAIPIAYYKIMVDQNEGRLRALAFRFDREPVPYARTTSRLVSIDALEEQTSLNFFSALTEEQQIELESEPAGKLWHWCFQPMFNYHFKHETQ